MGMIVAPGLVLFACACTTNATPRRKASTECINILFRSRWGVQNIICGVENRVLRTIESSFHAVKSFNDT